MLAQRQRGWDRTHARIHGGRLEVAMLAQRQRGWDQAAAHRSESRGQRVAMLAQRQRGWDRKGTHVLDERLSLWQC
jgi:hypothetical protein